MKNMNNHNAVIEVIRSSLRTLEADGWNIQFSWDKAHVGILGNEQSDQLAKQAARDENLQICYSRIDQVFLSKCEREASTENRINPGFAGDY